MVWEPGSVDGYPAAPRDDVVDVYHGTAVADPYRWLEDPNSQETVSWLQAQERLLGQHRRQWRHRDRFRTRLTELMGAGGVGRPVWRGKSRFHTRREPGQEHAVLLLTDPSGTERVLIDPMQLDPSGQTTLDAWSPSKEGTLLAYQTSTGGDEESVLRVMDLATGEHCREVFDRTRYSPVAWLAGGVGFFYVRRLPPEELPDGEEQFHRRVWLHLMGTDPDDDLAVFGADRDMRSYYGCSVSHDGRWLLISAATGTQPRNDLFLADLGVAGVDLPTAEQDPPLVPVQQGIDAQTSGHVGRDGRLYLFTDRDAPRGRLCVTDPSDPSHPWTELVTEDAEAVLSDFAVLDGPELADPVLLVSSTRHGYAELATHRLADGTRTGEVLLPGLGTVGGLGERPEGGHECWFGWTDHSTPGTVLRLDARNGEIDTWEQPPGHPDVPSVKVDLVTYPSADGTPVRMRVYSPGEGSHEHGSPTKTVPAAPRPTILYGYGGFGISMSPGYSPALLAWVESGGVYAVASLRGGGDEGEQWHRDGMLANKQNTFEDFHAAAEWLLANGWTEPGLLGISGGSNGGLLVGVALTQRPDLYDSVMCSAPLLDMLRYEQFGLGATWDVEYGTVADAEQFGWLHAYSPYHHVTPGTEYPPVLFTVFGSDTRVDPMHARKMCARLQTDGAGGPDSSPVLLRVESDAGHGARAVSKAVELASDVLAFHAHHLRTDSTQVRET